MTKEEKFNNLIFEGFKDKKSFDLLKHGLMRARELMLQHHDFEKASAGSQYEMCMTIYIIATQSATKAVHNFRIISKPEEKEFQYTLDEGFNPPKTIETTEIKVLK